MADNVERGQIWLLALPRPDKRRPVLVLSRASLLSVLHTATVAAITSSIRGSPTEVLLGEDEGLKHASAANLANIYTVAQASLAEFVGSLSARKMQAVCEALAIAVGCD